MPEKVNYNPDILSCLANLSSDEVFTPPEIANAMLDMLPQELFRSPDTKFLDPGCKSGVFLREIAKRLNEGLKYRIPEVEQRMDHIMKNQLFAIAITQITGLLSRRSVYCSKDASGRFSVAKFDNSDGNIWYRRVEHKWVDGRCSICGASQYVQDRGEELETHAYEFIHMDDEGLKELRNMKFDVIIGNPPYHLNDGGSGTGISAKPIYHFFVKQAKKLKPRYMTMIIPSRWFAGGKGLDEFREEMLHDSHVRHIVDFMSSKDCFPGVNIAGGVNYFLWDRDNPKDKCVIDNCSSYANTITSERPLNEFPIFVRDNRAVSIIHKFQRSGDRCLTDNTFKRNPFGFDSKQRGFETPIEGVESVIIVSSAGTGFIKRSDVVKAVPEIDRYKVTIGKVVPSNGEVDTNPLDGYKVTTTSRILGPGTVHTESYLLLHGFDSLIEARNFQRYMSLKFPRFMMKQTLSSMNISSENFRFVPFLDYSKEWTDRELYNRYGLSNEEISCIEALIRPMEIDEMNDGGADA